MQRETHTPEPLARNAAPERLELVREFINTAHLDHDEEQLPDARSLKTWLAGKGLLGPSGRVTEVDRQQGIELRESLRDILTYHTVGKVDTGTVKRFDAVVKKIPMRLRVDDTGWVRVAAAGSGFDRALGELLARVYEAMEDGSWQRMKACADDTCRWAFFDHSKNRSGHWCDMAVCGNRAKVNAFRQRRAATRGGADGTNRSLPVEVVKKA
jgi:predicted RNA-binding Zn ribbon-like protein